MKIVRIKKYYFDLSDKRYILLLIREKNLSLTDFCKSISLSRTAFYDTLNAKYSVSLELAEKLDKTLNTNYARVIKRSLHSDK